MESKDKKKALIKFIIIFSVFYCLLQAVIFYGNDAELSEYFWLENRNVSKLIERGVPAKSEFTPIIKIISDHHFWILRAIVLSTIFLAFRHRKRDLNKYILYRNISISAAFLLIIASGLTWTLKLLIGRPRPYTFLTDHNPFSLSTKYHSFPSGHTIETFSYIVPFLYYVKKKYIISSLIFFGLLVSSTRIILAYHYITDVISGIYITVIVGFYLCYYLEKKLEIN